MHYFVNKTIFYFSNASSFQIVFVKNGDSHFGNEQSQFALIRVDFRFLQKLGPDKQTLYKMDTSIRRTLFWSHEGVRLRES